MTCRRRWPSSPLLSRRKPDLGSSFIFSINPANRPNPNAWHISVRTGVKQPRWVLRGARHCSPCKMGERGGTERGSSESFVTGGEQVTGWREVHPWLLPARQMHLVTQRSRQKKTAEVFRASPRHSPAAEEKPGRGAWAGNRPSSNPAHRARPHLQSDAQLQRRSLSFPLQVITLSLSRSTANF